MASQRIHILTYIDIEQRQRLKKKNHFQTVLINPIAPLLWPESSRHKNIQESECVCVCVCVRV